MKKNILIFFCLLTFIVKAHTLKLYRSDLLVSKDKNVLVSEVSQIVLNNDVKNYRREILADTQKYSPADIKAEIDDKPVKISSDKGYDASIIIDLGKVEKGEHKVSLSYWYKIESGKNEKGGYDLFIPLFSRYRNPENINLVLEPQNFSYSLRTEDKDYNPDIELGDYSGQKVENTNGGIPLMAAIKIKQGYFNEETKTQNENKEKFKNKLINSFNLTIAGIIAVIVTGIVYFGIKKRKEEK